MKIQQLGKFLNISGATQQNSIASFFETTEAEEKQEEDTQGL